VLLNKEEDQTILPSLLEYSKDF